MENNKDLLEGVVKDLDLKEFDEEEIEEEEIEELDEEEDLEDLNDNDPEEDEEDEEDLIEEDDDDDDDDLIEVDAYDFNRRRTREEKQNHAFAELRRANREKEEELRRLENLAEAYGFRSYKEMVEQLENEAVDKRAKEENLDPKVYRRIHETEKKLEELERQREEERQLNRLNTVSNKIDNFIRSNGLNENHKEKLIHALDEDGFTLDDLYKINNPNRLFKGYISDDLNEVKRQRKLERERKRKALEENKFEGRGATDSYTIDDLIGSLVKNKKDVY